VETSPEGNGQQAEALNRLTQLQALTASLSEAVTSEQVAEAILAQAAMVLGTIAGVVARLSDDGREFICLHASGYSEEVVKVLSRIPADARMPLTDAVREGRPVLLANLAERDARYPDLARLTGVRAEGVLVALPLVVRGKAIGGIGLRFPTQRAFTEQDRAFLLTVTGLCAQALERARLYDTERAARERAERTENALRASEEWLRTIIDKWPSVIFVKDAHGRYLLANKACEAYAGEPVERIVGKTDHDYLPAKVADRFQADDLRVLQTGEALRYEEAVPRGGEERTSLTVKFPLRDASGQPYAVCGIATDITDLKQASEALRESEERFARFMQHLPGLAWVKDAQGRYVYANDAAARAFGKSPADLYGRTDEEVFPPTTAAQFRKNDQKALAGGAGVRVVETLDHEDGVLHHSLVSKFPIPGKDGRAALVGGMAIDITEEMRTRAVLEESEERFRATFEQAAVGIAHVGLDGRWLRVNRKLCDIVGYQPSELLALTFQDITHPDDLEADLAQVRRLLAGEIETYSMEKRYFHKDRSVLWINLTVSLVRTPEGQPKYFISVIEDITDKKQVQDALRESEQRLRSLSDNLPQGAVYQVLGDQEGRRSFLYISAGVERLFGVTPAEAVADAASLYCLVHEADRPRVAAHEEAALRDNAPFDCEFRSRTRSGGLVWVHARSAPRPLPTGQVVWEGIIMDVTARMTAERERADFAFLVENATDFIGMCDLAYRPFFINRAGLRMVGLESLEQAQRTPVLEFFFPEDRTFLTDEFFPKVLRDGHGEVEVRFRHFQTGEAIWVVYAVLTLRDERGQATGLATVGRNITERKQAEDRLRTQNERLRLLSESAGHLLSVEEPDAMVRGLFDRLKDHLGADAYFNFMVTDAGDALRLESCGGIPEETARSIRRLEFGQAICGTVALHRCPVVASRIQQSSDPKVQLVRGFGVQAYACNPLLAEGRLYGTLSFASRTRDEFTDEELSFLQAVTHYVTMAYERVRLIQRLREADRRKDEFLATLAHELRNPLAPIRNGLQVMKLAAGNAGAVEQARSMMERQMAVMVRLIDDLLDVSRITRGKLELRKERVDLASVVQSAIEGSRPLIEASGHRLSVSLPPEPVRLDADQTRLAQVFANLLTNAAKYTERGGQITLTARQQGGEVVVAVKDNGIGIAPEHLPRLFEMFSQVDAARERSQGGLGIGLALVKGLVEMHEGSVVARSDGLGKGSEFVARLPVAGDVPAPESSHLIGGDKARARSGRRILVADDNRDAADSLAMMLRFAGHEVHTAHDGQEAVEAAAWFRPDVALLDIGMPKLNGLEACRHIREQPWSKNVVLVAITGWGQEEDKRRAIDAGFDDHLTKPVDPAALMQLLADVETGTA
jgi:PAS domain S-box-containing protein